MVRDTGQRRAVSEACSIRMERRAQELAKEEQAFDRHAHAHRLPNPLGGRLAWRKRAVSEPAPPPEDPGRPAREEDPAELERGQVAAAQHVLRLLTPEAFSVLLYLWFVFH